MLKKELLDPQGEAILHALASSGFDQVESVRQNKRIDLNIDTSSADKARKLVEEMCRKLLVNEVIETYEIEIPA